MKNKKVQHEKNKNTIIIRRRITSSHSKNSFFKLLLGLISAFIRLGKWLGVIKKKTQIVYLDF